MRGLVVAAVLFAFATPCLAQTAEIELHAMDSRVIEIQRGQDDPDFVRSSDLCGASRYQHLVGEDARATPISFPPSTRFELRNLMTARTLEYTPHRLNVRMDETGRIVSIGCY